MAEVKTSDWPEGLPAAKTMTITSARQRLTGLAEELARGETRSVAITRRGQPVLALMPWELYESIVETLEILGDEELMASLRQGIRDIREGRTYSSEEARRMLEI